MRGGSRALGDPPEEDEPELSDAAKALTTLFMLGAFMEAKASVALDRDPEQGTHSVDDGCEGGHRGE